MPPKRARRIIDDSPSASASASVSPPPPAPPAPSASASRRVTAPRSSATAAAAAIAADIADDEEDEEMEEVEELEEEAEEEEDEDEDDADGASSASSQEARMVRARSRRQPFQTVVLSSAAASQDMELDEEDEYADEDAEGEVEVDEEEEEVEEVEEVEEEEEQVPAATPAPKQEERERRSSPIKLTLRVGQPSSSATAPGKRQPRAAAKKAGKRTKKAARDLDAGSDDELLLRAGQTGVDELDGEGEEDFDSMRSVSPSKLTARQRAKHDKGLQETLMSLPDSGKGKPILTEAERLLRREETARKRKRQSEQKRQDEQDQTINRLLRAQTSRTRNKLEDPTAESSPAPWATRKVLPPSTDMIRWTSSLVDDRVVLRIAAPEGKEDWIAVAPAPRPEPPRATNGVAPCGVQGCSEKRKYRSVKELNSGGCSLEHLKLFEASLTTV